MPDIKQWDAKVLATDIDTEMVRRGSEGVYPAASQEGIPADIARKYFEPHGADKVRVTQDARSLITFKHLNLIGNRSEEHTSELQSLMRISYAGFCFKKKNNTPKA